MVAAAFIFSYTTKMHSGFSWATARLFVHKIFSNISFFTVPTNAHFIHFKTLKSHIKILNICLYIFWSLLKPSSGGL
jgi:hypothetical protein